MHKMAKAESLTEYESVVLMSLLPLSRGICVGSLCERINCRAAQLSRTLTRLENCNLIRRSIDPDNRRKIIVTLTDQGSRIATKFALLFTQ